MDHVYYLAAITWSVFSQSVRTNSDVKGWRRRRLNGKASHGRLNLYLLLKLPGGEAVLVDVNVTPVKNPRSCVSSAGQQDQQVLACFVRGTGWLQESIMRNSPCEPPVM